MIKNQTKCLKSDVNIKVQVIEIKNYSQNQIKTIDYRNGKYQGFTQKTTFRKNGLGIFLDDDFCYILSHWKDNLIEGPFFCVFPDDSIMYGHLHNKAVGQFICYQYKQQFKIIISRDIIILDLLLNRSLLTFRKRQQSLSQFHEKRQKLQSKTQQIDIDIIKQEQIDLISSKSYKTIQQKYKELQDRINMQEDNHSYKAFIKKHFNDSNNPIQIIKIPEQMTINFIKTSIPLYLKLNIQTNQIKCIGSFNKYENRYQFTKKYQNFQSNIIQEAIYTHDKVFITSYNVNIEKRSTKCKKQLANFHRTSVLFIDQFVNTSYMNTIKHSIQNFYCKFNNQFANKIAQNQIQNKNSTSKFHKKNHSQLYGRIFQLDEVKQHIYQAVQKKQQQKKSKQQYLSRVTQISPDYKMNLRNIQSNKRNEPFKQSNQLFITRNEPFTPITQHFNTIDKNFTRKDEPFTIRNRLKSSQISISTVSARQKLYKQKNYRHKQLNLEINELNYPQYQKQIKIFKDHKQQSGQSRIKQLTQAYQQIKKQMKRITPVRKKLNHSPHTRNQIVSNYTPKSTRRSRNY